MKFKQFSLLGLGALLPLSFSCLLADAAISRDIYVWVPDRNSTLAVPAQLYSNGRPVESGGTVNLPIRVIRTEPYFDQPNSSYAAEVPFCRMEGRSTPTLCNAASIMQQLQSSGQSSRCNPLSSFGPNECLDPEQRRMRENLYFPQPGE